LRKLYSLPPSLSTLYQDIADLTSFAKPLARGSIIESLLLIKLSRYQIVSRFGTTATNGWRVLLMDLRHHFTDCLIGDINAQSIIFSISQTQGVIYSQTQ